MAKIKITCDSTCDLTREQYAACGAEVVPLGVTLGEQFCRDGVDVDAARVFSFVGESGLLPKTSAISVGEYADVFSRYTQEGYSIIHINISSEFSSCYQNACLAAQEVEGVYPIDSRNLSTGSGLLVLAASELAQQGLEAAQIAEQLEEMKNRLDVSFVLQTLEYLHKGGRCSGVAAFGANLLKLRPEIEVKDGRMEVGRKYRGSLEKTVLDYIRGRLEGRTDVQTDRIFVTHSHIPPELLEKTVALVKELQPFREVLVSEAGCTISSHCGPACFGVLFFRKEA